MYYLAYFILILAVLPGMQFILLKYKLNKYEQYGVAYGAGFVVYILIRLLVTREWLLPIPTLATAIAAVFLSSPFALRKRAFSFVNNVRILQ